MFCTARQLGVEHSDGGNDNLLLRMAQLEFATHRVRYTSQCAVARPSEL